MTVSIEREYAMRSAGNTRSRLGRDFMRLWVAGTISSLGTAVTTIALPIIALTILHASTFEVGLIAAAGWVSWLLLGLPAGVWTERVARRPLMIACDMTRALTLVLVVVAAMLKVLTVAHLVAAALIIGVGAVFYDIAVQTYLPAIVEPGQLVVGNGRMQVSVAAAQTGGPALGGALVQLADAPFSLVADFVSYLLSALLLSRIRKRETSVRGGEPKRVLAQMREGLAYVWQDPVLRPLLLVAAGVNFLASGFDVLLIPFLLTDLQISPAQIGVLLAVGGGGALLGAAAGATLARKLGDANVFVLAAMVGPILGLLVPASPGGFGVLIFIVGLFGREAGIAIAGMLARSFRQLTAPQELLARVTASIKFVSWGVMPIGALLGGTLGQVLGPRAGMWILCVLFLLTPAPIWLTSVRSLQHRIDQAITLQSRKNTSISESRSCAA